MDTPDTYTAFVGNRCIATGSLSSVLAAAKHHGTDGLLIFHDLTGKQIDFDMSGSLQQVLDRALPKPPSIGPGRPKLGVVSREVSLLPRHWEWLEEQPNGASASLRRLIDDARKRDSGESEVRRRVDACGRVMTALAGDLPGFEEAYRALYARDFDRLRKQISAWPQDVQVYLLERVISPA
jgi:hypothetical protein